MITACMITWKFGMDMRRILHFWENSVGTKSQKTSSLSPTNCMLSLSVMDQCRKADLLHHLSKVGFGHISMIVRHWNYVMWIFVHFQNMMSVLITLMDVTTHVLTLSEGTNVSATLVMSCTRMARNVKVLSRIHFTVALIVWSPWWVIHYWCMSHFFYQSSCVAVHPGFSVWNNNYWHCLWMHCSCNYILTTFHFSCI